MRVPPFVGLLGLVVLGGATYTLTSRTMAARQSSIDDRERVSIFEQGGSEANKPPSTENMMRVETFPFSSSRIVVTEVAPAAGGILLRAKARLLNSMRDRNFVWSIAIRRQSQNEYFVTRRYDHQIGFSRRGSALQPDFLERIDLLPGKYVVSIMIHEVPPGGVNELNDEENSKAYVMASGHKDVVILSSQ